MILGKMMRWIYFGLGVSILIVILAKANFSLVSDYFFSFGWLGFLLILFVYLIAFWIDAVSWLLAIESIPVSWLWSWRIFAVRIAGEAFNSIIPAAGIGGEPVKADILKRRFGINLRMGGASLIIARTVNMIALVAFLILGFAIVQNIESLSTPVKTTAGIGLTILLTGTAGLFLFQKYKLASRFAHYLAALNNSEWTRRIGSNLDELDQIFVSFYRERGKRFLWALSLAFINWLLGVVEIYLVMMFLGHPVEWMDAWVIEAAAQMMRTAAFFIPAAIGVQEGTFLFVCSLLTGNPNLGVATALIRRTREILWIVGGLISAAFLNSDRK